MCILGTPLLSLAIRSIEHFRYTRPPPRPHADGCTCETMPPDCFCVCVCMCVSVCTCICIYLATTPLSLSLSLFLSLSLSLSLSPSLPLSPYIYTGSLYTYQLLYTYHTYHTYHTYLETTVRCTLANMLWARIKLSIHSAGIREKATREREGGTKSDEQEDTCISTVFACAGKWQALPSVPICFTSARHIE